MREWFEVSRSGDGPLLAVALHHGHDLSAEVEGLVGLSGEQRLREEDPFTGGWTAVAPHRVLVHRSRFEADLNRPREKAIYLRPADAWGLEIWREPPPERLLERSLAGHDAFYRSVEELCRALEARWGSFLVLDLHSYNHRRDGPHRPPAPSAANPEINIGTGRLDRGRWGSVVGCFLDKLRGHDHLGRRLDARENVRFRGGHFSRWVNERFDACCLAIEVKKFFMDEWTGVPDRRELRAVRDALGAAAGGALEALSRAGRA